MSVMHIVAPRLEEVMYVNFFVVSVLMITGLLAVWYAEVHLRGVFDRCLCSARSFL